MDIIDFRLRPPLRGFLESRIYSAPENRDRYTRSLGFEPAPSAVEQSVTLLFEEMEAAGISRGVVVGRNTATLGVIKNEDVAAIANDYPDRFIPVGSVDPTNRKTATAGIDEAVALGCRAINLEPGVCVPPLYVDDRRLYPIYAHMEDRKIPVILMCGGGAGPDITYTAPEHIDRMLADFPELPVIASHGNWPWVQEIVSIAFRRHNLYLSPDMYLPGLPGHDDYVQAANGFLSDRFLFATAYPFCPPQAYTKWFRSLPINDEAMEKILSKNAIRILGL
jgi:predicted TIM-barrel fold metal-dependent hydrolase